MRCVSSAIDLWMPNTASASLSITSPFSPSTLLPMLLPMSKRTLSVEERAAAVICVGDRNPAMVGRVASACCCCSGPAGDNGELDTVTSSGLFAVSPGG